MKLLDLFWFFLDGGKSSGQILKEKKPAVQQVQQHESEEAEMVEEFDEQDFDEFFND